MNDLLRRGLDELSEQAPVLESPVVFELLVHYMNELELFNPALGLVGVADHNELIIKHILDSLAPLPYLFPLLGKPLSRIADVGTGAGLPGIPLAISLNAHNMSLLERMGRRVSFLRNTVSLLGLTNVDIEQTEAEKAAPGRFDVVCFRAFRPLEPDMLKTLFKLLAPGGCLAAWKARSEKIDEEMAAIENLCGSWEKKAVRVPFLEESRHLVLVRPLMPTSA